MSQRKQYIRHKIRNARPKKSFLRKPLFWIVLLIVVCFFSVGYLLFFYSYLEVSHVVFVGNEKVTSEDLRDAIAGNLKIKIIAIGGIKLYSESILLINNDAIDKEILRDFTNIESVSTRKIFPNTMVVTINERKPLGVFCASLDESQCYFIDQRGVIFDPQQNIPATTTIVRQLPAGVQVSAGEEVVNQNVMSTIYEIQEVLKDDFKIGVVEALITSPIRLNITTDKNWQIYFSLDQTDTIGSQLIKLNALINGGMSSDDIKNLQYIDLRPQDRAIICDNSTCGK